MSVQPSESQGQSQSSNHFSNLVEQIQDSPIQSRTDTLINGIVQQMQQSGSSQTQQLGAELSALKQQLSKACQQQQR